MNTIDRLPTHPGDVLKEELESRNITQKSFSEALNISYSTLNEVLNGKRAVSSDLALMVEASLGINPELLLNMQMRYDMALTRRKPSLIKHLQNIRKISAVF
ncbi:MAG: HigA family addiction module antitoxin [Bacteroidaceae bacterium]|nr:HigA family addiction module antitoxin [Bacteroidaceae bacterium]